MKQSHLLIYRIALMIFLVPGLCAVSATAQFGGTVLPILECIEPVPGSTALRAYFGYNNTSAGEIFIPAGSSRNYFTPGGADRNQPQRFQPDEQRNVFSIFFVPNEDFNYVTFYLDGNAATVRSTSTPCRNGSLTYQGRLTSGGAAASGNFDLQFRLFDQATGGNQVGSPVSAPNVAITNGVFTVSLDFGYSALNTFGSRFLEISVKPTGGNGAYTTLAPRQSLTEAPAAIFAKHALTASNALTAQNADQFGGLFPGGFLLLNTFNQQSGNFNLSGNGTLGGTLTVSTVAATILTANSATANKFLARGGAPGANNSNNNGYAFSGNNDSGLFSEANGQVSLYTNSGERVRVTDSGLRVFGTLTANAKSFQIDHPLDPANKVLNYTSIESPDMKNIYDGNALTDDKGEAVVRLPAYFDTLNRDFRYQLTVIGVFAQAIVAEEINDNQFKIRTDKPSVKVSWQITGIRRDRFAEDNRQPVEQNKSPQRRGKCLYEPACAPK